MYHEGGFAGGWLELALKFTARESERSLGSSMLE
jgi:hypothetical protein